MNALAQKQYKAKEIIFKQGEYAACMYDIVWGRVGIYADYGLPTQRLLTELNSEATFGEMGLVESRPRSATAVALEDTTLYVITSKDLGAYFQEKPAKIIMIMEQMSRRIRELTADYMDACRAASETVEAERRGEAKSGWLKTSLMKFSEVYRKAQAEGFRPDEP